MADFDFNDKASLDAFNTSIMEEFRSNAGVVGVTARELPDDDRATVFAHVVAASPGFGEYLAKTSRVIPLFELVRV